MEKAKVYQMAINAKERVASLLEREVIDSMFNEYYNMKSIHRFVAQILGTEKELDPAKGICNYAMQMTALSLYDVDDMGQVWAPSTRDVLKAYRKVKRALSKGKPLYATFIEEPYFDEESETETEQVYHSVRIA